MKKKLITAYVISILSIIPILFMSIWPLIGERLQKTLGLVYSLFGYMNNYTYYQYPINIAILVVFVISLVYAFKGSYRSRMVWLGCIFYFLYVQAVFFLNRMLFYTYDQNFEVLHRDLFALCNAYIIPLILLLAAFIIGLTSLKEIRIENKISYDKLARVTAIVFITYLVVIVSHLVLLLRIELLLHAYGGESMHTGGQDFTNMITIIPLFAYIVVTLLRKRESGAVIAPIALFPLAIPIIQDDLLDSFSFNVFKLIFNLFDYIGECLFQNLNEYVIRYRNDVHKENIDMFYRGVDLLLDQVRLAFLICGAVLIILFLRNVKKGKEKEPKRINGVRSTLLT
jgi:hypothetical protein